MDFSSLVSGGYASDSLPNILVGPVQVCASAVLYADMYN